MNQQNDTFDILYLFKAQDNYLLLTFDNLQFITCKYLQANMEPGNDPNDSQLNNKLKPNISQTNPKDKNESSQSQQLGKTKEQLQLAKLYFEKQSSFSNNCLVHALNNFFGSDIYNHQKLDNVCKNLSSDFINPHKSFLGGDYDVNVLFACLNNQQRTYKWHDKRIPISHVTNIQLKIEGFIINKRLEKNIYHKLFRLSARHWLTIKIINNLYIKLDSLEKNYQVLDIKQAQQQLNKWLNSGGQIIEIYQREK